MDFNEDFKSIVEHSLGDYDSRKILLRRVLNNDQPFIRLKVEAEQTRLWLFDHGVWNDPGRTIKVVAPKDDEVLLRLLYPLTNRLELRGAKPRAKYNLDSSARIWTRGRGQDIYVRDFGEFESEPEVSLRIIELLRTVRSEVGTS